MPTDPMEEKFREDYKKTVLGEMKAEEFEIKLAEYEAYFGKEKLEELLYGDKDQEEFDMMGSWEGFDELEKIVEEERRNIDSGVPDNEEFLGKFLVAWLTVEYAVNKLLFEQDDITSPRIQQMIESLPFAKRIKSLPRNRTYSRVIGLLFELKNIRNAIAHTLRFSLDEITIGKELKYHLGKDVKGKTREEVIIALLYLIEFYLLLETKALKSKKDEIVLKYPVLKDLGIK